MNIAHLSEQEVFDLFVKTFGRYPKDENELREVVDYCTPFVAWDRKVTRPIRPASLLRRLLEKWKGLW